MNDIARRTPVILQTGFRVFFLGAAVYAVVSMLYWKIFYVMGKNIFVAMPLTVWHGHEMIFGFTMAVVAGFLLTAVMNWTGRPTLSGVPLLILFLLWVTGRVLAFMPGSFPIWPLAASNLAFITFLAAGVIKPIAAAKQWKQSAVFSKLLLIFIAGAVFYAALANGDLAAERKALRFCVYMLISLIFTIGRRIMPFFTERGVGYPVTLRNSRFLDITSLIALVLFSILDIFWPQPAVIISLCAVLVGAHCRRLAGWYTPGVRRKPLLWVLFTGYAFLILGFGLKIFSVAGNRPDDLALHAWTAGGIGIFTLGMMARVSWGHTGRDISNPPRSVAVMFAAVILSAIFRVFPPIFYEPYYIIWIAVSQGFWIIAFGLFAGVYGKVLVCARPDGKPG